MKIVLVGNQNSGKSSLFNTLTFSNQKVGNWSGVTVEKKSGIIRDTNYELIDLPGTYSLFPYSEEEKITCDYLLNEDYDLIINVVDSTSIERSLYLTTQLFDLDKPVIMVLNMCDLLDKKGIKIDENKLENELKIKVIKVSTLKNKGIEELINSLSDYKRKGKKLMYFNNDYESISNERYNYISKLKELCVDYSNKKESISEKIDKVILNKWLAIPIFALVMFGIYYLSIDLVSNITIKSVNKFSNLIKNKTSIYLNKLGVSSFLISLIVDGICSGFFSIFNFIPQLTILFLCISILETSGYMARVSFIFDTLLNKIGLSGKSLVSFIVGSGCSVSGIMSSKVIENKEEREKVIMLTPFIPCSAKLPIIALFASYFFPQKAGLIGISLYFLSILIIIILALIFKNKEETSFYINELVDYKVPDLKYVLKDTFNKVLSFIKRASSVILVSSIIMWFMLSFSFKLEYGINIDNSILASIGRSISWIFYPLINKCSWEASVSIIQGLIAKEEVVSSMNVISGLTNSSIFESASFNFFDEVSAYAFVTFNLFSAPCISTISAMKKELGNNKKVSLIVLLQIAVAWVVAFFINLVGNLIR